MTAEAERDALRAALEELVAADDRYAKWAIEDERWSGISDAHLQFLEAMKKVRALLRPAGGQG